MEIKLAEAVLARMLDTSYRNLHAKGVDYVCLQRSDKFTLKVYFFDIPAGPTGIIPDVVNPHDHRYNFRTSIIRGAVSNSIWAKAAKSGSVEAKWFERYRYYTPLNKGHGFEWEGRSPLVLDSKTTYTPGQQYSSLHNTIHTIGDLIPGTILVLEQYEDVVPIGTPTRTYIPIQEHSQLAQAPELSGLYDRFTEDQLLARLDLLQRVSPGALAWAK